MKNQTITTSLNFTSDVSDAISGLKKLREQMGNLTTDQSIFGNVDKEFEKVQKAMRDLAAKKEFTGTAKGAAEYKKILDSITVSANKIGQELTQIGTNANGAFKFKNVEQAQRVLTGLESNLKLVNKGLKDAQRELSTGLKNLGINEITAKTLQGEQAVTEELRKQYELRKQNYENLAASQRAGIASKLSNSVRKINTTSIVDPGTDKFKGTAADTVQSSIQTALAEGIKQSQTWEQVQLKILEDLNKSQIVVQNIDKLLEPIKNDFQEAALKAGSEADNVKKAREEMEALGRIGENGVFQFSQGAQSAIDLANSVDKAKQSQTDLKGQVEATKQSIQQEGQTGQQSLNQITAGTEQAVQQTKNFVNAEHQSTDAIREQHKEQENLNNSMSRMQSWIVNILSIGNAWRKFTQVIRQTFNDVQKLDKAFASIAMVTNKTVEGLWATYDQYADMANRLGQSTESAIKASALFYQQGLDTADALRLTEDTMKLATLAGADFETATQQMTAALRGFHMEMDQGAHVTDVYSELAAHAAADVNGIAYAMSKTASIASSAGMSFETTAAFLTNMIETTQEAPENIGTAMKTIIARFTELKENVSAADSEFDDLDYNKVDKALKSVGIQLKDANGQFRNLDDVFLELSQKWDSLDRNTQRYIATIAAGSRQQSRFIAMMEDYDRTMQLVETAQDSAGRSSEQFAKYQDTVEYKLNQLKNSWEQFRTSLIDSDVFKKAIEGLTGILNKLNKLDTKKLLALGATFVTLGKYAIQSFMQSLTQGIPKAMTAAGNLAAKGTEKLSRIITDKLKKVPYDITVTIKEQAIKADIERLKQQISNTSAEIKVHFNETQAKDFQNIVNVVENKIRLAAEEGKTITFVQAVTELKATDSQLGRILQSGNQVAGMIDEWAKEIDATNVKIQELEGEMEKASSGLAAETAAQRGSQVGSAFATSFTMAATMVFTDAKPGEVFVKSFLPAALQGISTFLTTWIAAIGTGEAVAVAAEAAVTLGISVLIAAVLAGVAALSKVAIDAFKPMSEKLQEAVDAAKEFKEASDQTAAAAKDEAKTQKEKVNSMKSLKEEYEELSRKALLTNEEQERYKEITSEIQEQLPEIVTYYDEMTGELTVQNDLWDQILEKESILAKKRARESLVADIQSLEAEYSLNVATARQEYQAQNEEGISYITSQDLEEYQDAIVNGITSSVSSLEEAYKDYADKDEKIFNEIVNGDRNGNWLGNNIDFKNLGIQLGIKGIDEQGNFDLQAQKDLINVLKWFEKDIENINEKDILPEEKEYYLMALDYIKRSNAQPTEEQIIEKYAKQTKDAELQAMADYIVSTTGLSQNSAKNIAEGTFKKHTVDISSLTYDELKTNYSFLENYFKDKGIENQNDYHNKIKNTDEIQKIIAAYGASKEIDLIEITDEQKKIIEELDKNITQKTPEEFEKILQEYRGRIDDVILNSYQAQSENLVEEVDTTLDKINNALKSNLSSEDMTYEAAQALWANLDNAIKKVGEQRAEGLFGSFNQIFSRYNLNQTQSNNLLSFDWDNITLLNYDEYKDKFTELCEELGIEGADALYEEMLAKSQAYSYTDLVNIDEEKLTEYVDSLTKMADDAWKAEDNFVKAITAAKTGEALDPSTYEEIASLLEEWGFNAEDYMTVMEDGSVIVTNADDLATAYYDQLNAVEQTLEKQKEQIKAQITLLKQERDRLELELQTAEVISAQNELKIAQESKDVGLIQAASRKLTAAYKKAQRASGITNQQFIDIDNSIKEYEDFLDTLDGLSEKESKKAKARAKDVTDKITESLTKAAEDSEKAAEETGKEVDDLAKKAEEAADKVTEAWEKVADAQEKVNEALEKIKEKEQDVIDKTEELNKILYGDQYHKNKLDAMYNYSTALDAITTKTSRAKSSLESYNGKEDVSALMQTYMQGAHAEVVNRSAQNEVIAASIRNYEQVLSSKLAAEISSMNAAHGSHMSTNISDYVYKNGDVTAVNFQALNAAQLPDEISDYVEECVETINNLQKQIDDNTEAIKQKEKEIRDMRKNALQRRVNLEKEVADILKKQAEDEVKTQKDKYDALKDADDDYLNALEEAINKERELRERNKEWDDLATKEKKLSLMQRDTSGANAKEVMSLEQDVQDTRENLLDKTIDDMLKGMKEMYELQQESREKELEYQEAMMESTEWIKQATAIIDGWTTSDDMVTWFIENATEEYTNGSAAVQESMRMSWEDTGNQMVADSEMLSQDMSNLAVATHEEISRTVIETSEVLTTQADFSLQFDAIKEVQDARDDYKKAIQDLEEMIAEAKEAEAEALAAKQEYDQKMNETPSGSGGGLSIPSITLPTISSSSSSSSSTQEDWQVRYTRAKNSRDAATTSGAKSSWQHAMDDIARQAAAAGVTVYKKGGLVNYTGPAWVDGTTDEPEAFLSAEDTKRIGAAAELLASLPFFSGGSINNSVNNGDSLIEVHINIENISSDVDLDNALDKMKNAIWEAANPAGSSVILSK